MLSLVRKLDGGSRSFWMALLLVSMVFGTGPSTFALLWHQHKLVVQ